MNTDNNEHGFVRLSSMTSNFLDNTCTKIQNIAFKTSQMDQIALEYWYYGFLGRLRVDGRGFLHRNANLEKLSAGKKSSCRTCAEACHSPFKRQLNLQGFVHNTTQAWLAGVVFLRQILPIFGGFFSRSFWDIRLKIYRAELFKAGLR